MKAKDIVGVLLASLKNENGQIDDAKAKEWTEFMFENEPIANSLRDYCGHFGISNHKMYQLIALGFMSQKTARQVDEWQKSMVEMQKGT